MTPQERDLITALLARLQQAANRPRDPEADALIRQAMKDQPDAPYLLVQTVLIQDMSLSEAQRRITELERELAATKAAPAAASTSFLGDAGRGAPPAGPWSRPAPAPGPVWTQSAASPPPQQSAMMAPPALSPWAAPGASSGFLQQAVATAAGVAGGALLFEGIQSMFGPHYAPMLGGMPVQPGINETVINNYYGDAGGYDSGAGPLPGGPVSDPGYSNDPGFDTDPGGIQSADDLPSDDDDFGDDSSFDV